MRIGVIYLGRHGPGGPISLELASHLSKKADVFAVVSRQAEYISCWLGWGPLDGVREMTLELEVANTEPV